MNIAHNHIVEKVFVEINTKDSELAFSLKNDVSEFLKNILIPKIENLFDNMFADGEIYRIEKVEINSPGAQVSLNESVADNVVDKIAAALRRTFETDSVAVQSKNLQLIASDLNNEQIFLSFIQMGSLPWHAGDFNMEEFQHNDSWNKILSDDKFIEKVKTVLKKEIRSLERFVKQVSFNNVISFFIALNPEMNTIKTEIQLIYERLSAKVKSPFLMAVFQSLVNTKNSENWSEMAAAFLSVVELSRQKNQEPELIRALRNFSSLETSEPAEENKNEKDIAKAVEKNDWSESTEETAGKSSLYIQNAGLILLHPFLKNFFINTQIAVSTGKIAVENFDLAVQALHFIATGQESVFEYEMVFEKFLCGVPLHNPIIRESLLTEEIKNEAEEMLFQAVGIWSVLKSSSVDSLRENFIQRNGILEIKENGNRLTVDAKSWDILLEKLPWNITVVNWYLIEKLIYVEWQYEGI